MPGLLSGFRCQNMSERQVVMFRVEISGLWLLGQDRIAEIVQNSGLVFGFRGLGFSLPGFRPMVSKS